MNLTIDIINDYGFGVKVNRPDYDDVQNTYTLPNGLELTCLTVCNNEPVKVDSLEGLDGFIYITTKEELDVLINKSFEDICNEIAKKEKDFNIEDYL